MVYADFGAIYFRYVDLGDYLGNEGIGISVVSSTLYNNHLVSIKYSGFTEYVKNIIAINHKLVPADPCASYHKLCKECDLCKYYACYNKHEQKWAQFDEKDAIKKLKWVYANRDKIDTKKNYEYTKKHFSMQAIGKKFKEILEK